jgi:hypothetical protein
VNRRDAFGRYIAVEDRRASDDPEYRTVFTEKGLELTLAIIQQHYKAGSTGDLIGLHALAIDENSVCWSRWLGIDIDRHDETVNPEVNMAAAKAWYTRAVELGFQPLLLDSNGRGGYHLWLIFDGPVVTEKVFAFGKWLTRDWKEQGLKVAPETYPKQASIKPGHFGNWLRLPGRHHTFEHFTRVWSGERWLKSQFAIKAILGTTGSSADLIPGEILEAQRSRSSPKPIQGSQDLGYEVALAKSALEHVRSMADGYDSWVNVGMCLTPLGRAGLELWDAWSRCSDKYREGDCARKWGTFTSNGGLGLGSLFAWAKSAGWPGPDPQHREPSTAHSIEQTTDACEGRDQAPGSADESVRDHPSAENEEAQGRIGEDEVANPQSGAHVTAVDQGSDSDGTPRPEGDDEATWSFELIEHKVTLAVDAGDKDAFLENRQLQKALARLQDREPAQWIKIRDVLKPLIGRHDLGSLLKPHRAEPKRGWPKALPQPSQQGRERGVRYVVEGGWTHVERADLFKGVELVALAPFVAWITEKVFINDGLKATLRFRIAGKKANGTPLPELDLSAQDFNIGDWPITQWGVHIEAVKDVKSHIKAATMKLSGDIPTCTVYQFVGWYTIEEQSVYLHAGGAIGAGGADPQIQVQLSGRLANYALPEPPAGEAEQNAIRAVFKLLDLADPKRPGAEGLAAVAICLPFRAALGETLFNVWLEGSTGAYKTELAANVLQRFFGTGFHRESAPGSWSATENALEIQAFEAKDALFLIDDYRPPEGFNRAKYEEKASRLLRNAVDRRGRDRGKTDGSLQVTKYPRGTVVVTGETGPPSGDQAATGRTLIIKIVADNHNAGSLGTLDKVILRACSNDARDGLYALAMAGFLRFIAPGYQTIRKELRRRVDCLTDEIRAEVNAEELHHRTPEIVADLLVAFEEFLRYALHVQAITSEAAERYKTVIRESLIKLANDQREHHRTTDPIEQFQTQLAACLASGNAGLVMLDGKPPEGLEAACGWKQDLDGRSWRNEFKWKIGWIEDRTIYLLMDNAYAAAASIAPLSTDKNALSRRLKDRGLLLRTEGPARNTIKKTCERTSYRVLVLAREFLVPTPEDSQVASAPLEPGQ